MSQSSSSHRLSIRRKHLISSAVITSLAAVNSALAVDSTWTGPAAGNWSLNTNWSGSVMPTGGAYNVFIDGGAVQNSAVVLNLNIQINNLSVGAGDSLTTGNNLQLQVVGTSISNAGTITIGAAANNSILRVDSNPVNLTGGGTLVLSTSGGGTAFLIGSTMLTNVNNTIRGRGAIGNNENAFTNQATVVADVAGALLTLDPVGGTDTLNNSGTMTATGGGILQFTGFGSGNVLSTGTISAQNASEVRLINSAIISGGTFATSGTGSINVAASNTAFIGNFTNTGHIAVSNNATLYMQGGSTTNSGSINVNAGANNAILTISGTQTTAGAGTINLTRTGGGIAYINGSGTWTNSNRIQGAGMIGNNELAVVNSALIMANNGTYALNIDPVGLTDGFVNNGTLQANGGVLSLTGYGSGDFLNTNGRILATTSDVQLINDVSIKGGTLGSSGAASIRVQPSQPAFFTNLSNTGVVNVDNNATLYVTGAINNTGTINLNAAANPSTMTVSGATATFSGGGTIFLNQTAGGIPYLGNNGTITNVNNVIRGSGTLGANGSAFINQASGLIVADVSGKTLTIDPIGLGSQSFVNQGNLRAIGGGFLDLNGYGTGEFDNAAGTIEAQNGSEVRLHTAASVTGGTLATAGTGIIRVPNSTQASLTGTRITGNLHNGNNSTLYLAGTTTVSGSIHLNAAANASNLVFAGGGTLSGTGSVLMNQSAGGVPGISGGGTLTSGIPISGAGALGGNTLAVVNTSTITATHPTFGLEIDPVGTASSFVNNGTLQSSTGVLVLTGYGNGDFVNTGGRIIAGAKDVQLISAVAIAGGTLSGASTGITRVMPSQSAYFTTLANSGNVTVDNNATLYLAGAINNTGSFNVTAGANGSYIYTTATTTFSGSGTINMNQTGGGIPYIYGVAPFISNQAITGAGSIGANSIAFTNNSTITANNGTYSLTLDPIDAPVAFVNNGTLQSAAGILVLTGYGNGAFNNTNGRIIAGVNDVQMHSGASISGGTISGAGTGITRVIVSNTASINTLTTTGNLTVDNNATLYPAGTITNTGSINVNAGANGSYIYTQGAATFSGGGTLFMNRSAGGIPYLYGVAPITNNSTIIGAGEIGANSTAVLNSGTIIANNATYGLTLDPADLNAFTNNGLLRATGGGNLIVTGYGNGTFAGTGSVDVQANSRFTAEGGANFTNNPISSVGTVTVQNSSNVSTTVLTGGGSLVITNSSSLTVRPNGTQAATSKVSSVAITNSSQLNLNDNALVVDYTTTSPLATIRSNIFSGFNTGSWNGAGIMSSTLPATPARGLGYAEASATAFATTFRGQSFTGDAVLVMNTYKGDANLDRVVNSLDFNKFAAGYGLINGSGLWSNGDFDYDGKINTLDFNWLAGNFGLSLPAAGDIPSSGDVPLPGDLSSLGNSPSLGGAPSLGAVVPEPAALMFMPVIALLARRRRSHGQD